MPWEKQYSRPDVLRRAMRAFWARGYEATSMSDLVAATGINRGSIYSAFDGKRSLFIEALRYYDRRHRAAFLQRITSAYPPKDAIMKAFELAAHGITGDDNPGGCLIVNTALELSPHDAEIAGLVEASINDVETFFRDMIENAQQAGSVDAAIPANQTAKSLLGLFLGLRVLTRIQSPRETLNAITSQARMMLE